jgi:hypothetical protein
VAVEKLASEKCPRIKTRQEAPQTICSGRLDIFYLSISAYLEKKGLFQQPQGIITSNLTSRLGLRQRHPSTKGGEGNAIRAAVRQITSRH